MATTTEGEIRDRIATLIREVAPTTDPLLPFRQFTDELGANFRRYALAHATGATRLYQVQHLRTSRPLVSNGDVLLLSATFRITVAYHQSHLFGAEAARARADVIREDEKEILAAVGMHARANFTAPTYPDAWWVGGEEPTIDDRSEGVDFWVLEQVMQFYRAV